MYHRVERNQPRQLGYVITSKLDHEEVRNLARDFDRVAVIGNSQWEKAALKVFGALTPAQCRFFERGQADRAWAWLDA